MPVFSLPSGHGIGDLGESAFGFVDFLKSAGQSIWQLLPMGPAARGNSPYSSYSAFAGSPLFISISKLVELGLLPPQTSSATGFDTPVATVNYSAVRKEKKALLQLAYQNFVANDNVELKRQFAGFCQAQADWLDDFVLFEALAIEQDDFDLSLIHI